MHHEHFLPTHTFAQVGYSWCKDSLGQMSLIGFCIVSADLFQQVFNGRVKSSTQLFTDDNLVVRNLKKCWSQNNNWISTILSEETIRCSYGELLTHVAAIMLRRPEPTNESRTDDHPRNSNNRVYPLDQIHSAIAVANSTLYAAQNRRQKVFNRGALGLCGGGLTL